jgi:hypothetical protein
VFNALSEITNTPYSEEPKGFKEVYQQILCVCNVAHSSNLSFRVEGVPRPYLKCKQISIAVEEDLLTIVKDENDLS